MISFISRLSPHSVTKKSVVVDEHQCPTHLVERAREHHSYLKRDTSVTIFSLHSWSAKGVSMSHPGCQESYTRVGMTLLCHLPC